MDRRRQWVVSMIVAVGAAVLVAVAVLFSSGDSCEEWQERYEAALESMGAPPGASGSLQFINMGPLAGLEDSKPEGCPTPG